MKKGPAVAIDLADIARFRAAFKAKNKRFFEKIFSGAERAYCLSYKDPSPHFAGTFAAKEAVRKTSEKFHSAFNEIEIRRELSGKPEVWVRGKKERSLSVSITHTKTTAGAVALYFPL